MIEDKVLEEGVAPSYYIEGLLSNAADNCFGHSFERTFLQCIHYLRHADKDQMMCANGIHWLVRTVMRSAGLMRTLTPSWQR